MRVVARWLLPLNGRPVCCHRLGFRVRGLASSAALRATLPAPDGRSAQGFPRQSTCNGRWRSSWRWRVRWANFPSSGATGTGGAHSPPCHAGSQDHAASGALAISASGRPQGHRRPPNLLRAATTPDSLTRRMVLPLVAEHLPESLFPRAFQAMARQHHRRRPRRCATCLSNAHCLSK